MTSNDSDESRSRGNISSDMDLEKDVRPEHSPYASETCAVLFRDGKRLYIPRDLLNQVEPISRSLFRGGPKLKAHFTDITSATGHVLLHFLVCGVYQCLRPEGDSLEKRRASEFKTALDVYVAADSLQLPRLRDLARREITRVGDTLSLPSIISAIEDSDVSFKTLPGVIAYVESRILSFGEEATPAAIDSMLSELEGPNTLSRTLLKSMVLLKSSELFKQQQELDENEGQVFFGAPENVLEDKMRKRRMSPTEQAMKEAEAKAETISKEKEMLPLAEKAFSEKEEASPAEEAPAAEADEEPAAETDEKPAEEAVWETQSRLDKEEIYALIDKQAQRGGRLLKRDRMRLELLLGRSPTRADLAQPEAAALPAMDDRLTLDLPKSLNVGGDYWETASLDRPGSRSSETWSFAGTPASHSSQVSPQLEASKVDAEGKEEDFWDALLKRGTGVGRRR
ncbi:hypothetical protein B0J15DRAFT_538722 [Fusarium solani]|uniref:BTB domain-containing protein n=1 Tax=Fusarium solani TaxID=169388 RepID=A0A9P9G8T9_FUSSL|nr:uncharacterized protein B0J15DRAFT_538722 [Fusarium solani]KAH7235113.1 hypothetical protein B0J15DRAFT_538722 [Fusarium solani]